ncbi:MAG: hypothetical protein ACLTDR_08965 [Adlercreutzia equolifaciens]
MILPQSYPYFYLRVNDRGERYCNEDCDSVNIVNQLNGTRANRGQFGTTNGARSPQPGGLRRYELEWDFQNGHPLELRNEVSLATGRKYRAAREGRHSRRS